MPRLLILCLFLCLAFAPHLQVEANDELVATVIGFLGDSDKEIRTIAFEQIRNDAKGTEATKEFASQLPNLDKEAQVGLLSALGDREDAAAKPAVLGVLSESSDDAIRTAAIIALGKLGDTTDCPSLVGCLSEKSAVSIAARQALVSLQGEGVSREVVNQIGQVEEPLQISLIEILTARRAKDAIPALLKMATGNTAALRVAAMSSLGQLADATDVPAMVQAVLSAELGDERNDAERNLMRVCSRIENKEERADPLLVAMADLSANQKTAMLQALGRIGGKTAMVEIEKAISSRDPPIHLAGIRGISNWPDASVANQLINLAKTDAHADHRRIARMTILRIAPLPDGRSDAEKLELLKIGMELADDDNEKKYGLQRAAPIRLIETLRFILPYLEQPQFAKEACQSIVELAHDRQLRDSNKSEFHAALDKVIATTTDAVLVDRANRYKQGQTWVRPK